MRTLSPLEILPIHIVELILDHVTSTSRRRFDDVSVDSEDFEEYAKLVMPLLASCPNFAPPIYARIFRVYDMYLTDASNERRTKPSLPTCPTDSGVSAYLYTKVLAINVDILDVYSGAALTYFPRIDYTFPMVRSVMFKLLSFSMMEQPDADAYTSPDGDSKIDAFVQRIKQLAPRLRKVSIYLEFCQPDEDHIPHHRLTSLVGKLSQYAEEIDYEFYHTLIIIDQRLDGLCSLVYSGYEDTESGEEILELAQRNASTLQHLEIRLVPITDITYLIRNVDGGYVQYPCLHTLKIGDLGGDDDDSRHPVFPGVVPFPSLRRLDIGSVNPFGDDTAFRGNAATLESLTLWSNHTTFQILREGKVFTPVSHPKLQYVSLEVNLDSEPDTFESDAEFMRFVMSIGPNAPVRIIYDQLDGPGFQHVIPVFAEHTCIQILELCSISLSLWDTIALVKALPQLTDLHTWFPVLSVLPNEVAEDKLPEYVIANYAPTGERFRCWHFLNYTAEDMGDVVRCVFLLALVCPNFGYVATKPRDKPQFIARMKEMIRTDHFRPYATRLERFLYD
ncbi:hypothetical protein FBU31_000988 [Coemansia sp. 'formosensis']|nr:hypothetical protein FBU31_000988 [Coemansia sp. 'formosensis']